jgi:hypothetical protein
MADYLEPIEPASSAAGTPIEVETNMLGVPAVKARHTGRGGGIGVDGFAREGEGAGVVGSHLDPKGHGVEGVSRGGGIGVFGTSFTQFGDPTGAGGGVVGEVAETGAGTAGVLGRHKDAGGHGVRGEGGIGVVGLSSTNGFAAVFGDHTGAGVGVVGDVAKAGAGTAGVLGRHKGVGGAGHGVRGEGGIGVVGVSSTTGFAAVWGDHTGAGVGVVGEVAVAGGWYGRCPWASQGRQRTGCSRRGPLRRSIPGNERAVESGTWNDCREANNWPTQQGRNFHGPGRDPVCVRCRWHARHLATGSD